MKRGSVAKSRVFAAICDLQPAVQTGLDLLARTKRSRPVGLEQSPDSALELRFVGQTFVPRANLSLA